MQVDICTIFNLCSANLTFARMRAIRSRGKCGIQQYIASPLVSLAVGLAHSSGRAAPREAIIVLYSEPNRDRGRISDAITEP
jgi:hypothetical protein